MPELPEVETIRRQLRSKIVGKLLNNQKIVDVRRRAKILMVDFKDGSSLVFHLKMTGQLIFNGGPWPYTRKVFNFKDGTKLFFNDARRFGWYKKVKDTSKIEKEFGPEAWTISLKELKAILTKKPKSKIKPLLLDQKMIAGIGNIYSDEILFEALIHPQRQAGKIREKEIERLLKSIKKVLKEAVKRQGSSVGYYLNAYGQQGAFARQHQVYQKHGKKCPRCQAGIKKIKLAQRGTHYCPKCQK